MIQINFKSKAHLKCVSDPVNQRRAEHHETEKDERYPDLRAAHIALNELKTGRQTNIETGGERERAFWSGQLVWRRRRRQYWRRFGCVVNWQFFG